MSPREMAAGRALVGAQFALMIAVVVMVEPSLWGTLATGLAALGATLGGWTLVVNRPGNFNVHPKPREGGRLVTSGPYRFVRHPMYAAVLAFVGGLAAAGPVAAWAAWAALAAVLAAKARLEERSLVQVHPGYEAYRAKTKAIVPFLF